MREAIGFSSRWRAASRSSRLTKVLVGKLRQITEGELRPASKVLSHYHRHILLGVMEAGKFEIWRNYMLRIILDLLIELQMSVIMMSVIMLIIEDVDLGRGSTQGLMYTRKRRQDGLS